MQLVGIIDGMDARNSVLLVEPGTDTYMSAMLGRCGFTVTVTPSAEIALFELGERRVDVVVATLSLPGMGSAAFCRELRRGGAAPIVVVTAANDEDWVDAMSVGADDHVHMPCDHWELRARLNSVIRRSRPPHSPARCVQVGELVVSVRGREVETDPPLVLTPIQAAVLGLLAERPGRFVSEAALRQRLQRRFGGDAADRLDNDIQVLARAVALLSAVPNGLQHFEGIGWRLTAHADGPQAG